MSEPTSIRHAHNFKELSGHRFGRLVALHHVAAGRSSWSCRCDCGNLKLVTSTNLQSGHTLSCGCLTVENRGKSSITHGKTKSRAYKSWFKAKSRCNCRSDKQYDDYGGRGVVVCDRWMRFEDFYEDMGDPPAKHTINRINNDGNYSCGKCDVCIRNGWAANCRWATPTQQVRNRRTTIHVTIEGQTKTLLEWCQNFNLPYKTVHQRLRSGWSHRDLFVGLLSGAQTLEWLRARTG